MCASWRIAEYLRTSSMENLPLANDPVGAQLMYKDGCKQDMKTLEISPESWEDIAANRNSWRCLLHKQLKEGKEKVTNKAIKKRTRQKEKNNWLCQIYSHLLLMWQGLPFPHWPHKPQVALLRAKHYELTMIEHSAHDRL